MAQLPPRRSINTCRASCHRTASSSSLQVLQQMGFAKNRAEKALAATGHRGPQLAADWLLAHVNDPTLDDYTPREYILYLCPSGSLKQEIESFFSKSLDHCGWNTALNYLPNITLCSFFQAPDEYSEQVVAALCHCVEKMCTDLPTELHLTPHLSPKFVGLFINEDENDILKRFAMLFMRECGEFVNNENGALQVISTCFPWCSSYPLLNSRRIEVEPYLKNLHITLAYQFQEKYHNVFESMVKEIKLDAPSSWEIRLYSRDYRIRGNEVYRVLYPHVPQQPDELELLIDDFVYINGEQLKSSADGWVEGVSWLTGCRGMLPINYIQRTAESDAWTLHKCISINCLDNRQALNQLAPSPEMINIHRSTNRRMPMTNLNCIDSKADNISLISNIDRVSKSDIDSATHKEMSQRRLIVVRHGERMDFTFDDWVLKCFKNDKYIPFDLNHPKTMPERADIIEFIGDTSLTRTGAYQAQLVGEALKDAKIEITAAYSSSALRCVQTCHNILKGLDLLGKVHIKVEPGLFEYFGWHQLNRPKWMSVQELLNSGYAVDLNYKPIYNPSELINQHISEDVLQYYERSTKTTRTILESTKGNILFVGHACSLDGNIRGMAKEPEIKDYQFKKFLTFVPYCANSVLVQQGNEWKRASPVVPGINHAGNRHFDYEKFIECLTLE